MQYWLLSRLRDSLVVHSGNDRRGVEVLEMSNKWSVNDDEWALIRQTRGDQSNEWCTGSYFSRMSWLREANESSWQMSVCGQNTTTADYTLLRRSATAYKLD